MEMIECYESQPMMKKKERKYERCNRFGYQKSLKPHLRIYAMLWTETE